jgi:hypothetical protein
VVWESFVEVVAQEPSDAQAVGGNLHEPTLGANVHEEQYQLQAKEDHRVDAGPSRAGLAILNEIPDAREVQPSIKAAVEVLLGDELFEREVGRKRSEVADLVAHRGGASSCGRDEGGSCYRRSGTFSSAHLDPTSVFQQAAPFHALR